jgi:hypothetical protein
MLMKVAHAKSPTFGLSALEPTYPEDFVIVAEVKVPEGQKPDPDWAFQQTNHINEDFWWENEGVTLIGLPNYRSTSVGDLVLMPDGEILRCESVGWKLVAEGAPER